MPKPFAKFGRKPGGFKDRQDRSFNSKPQDNSRPRYGSGGTRPREGGFRSAPREGGFSRDRPREGGFDRPPRREGGFSRERSFDRPREGGFSRERSFDRPRESSFNRDRPREGGFRREGGFSRDRSFDRPREGGYRSGPREGGFRSGPREGGFRGGDRGGFRRDGGERESFRPRDAFDPDFKFKRGVGRRAELLERARQGTREAMSEKGASLGQAVKAVDDLDSTKSLLFERLVEWFSSNFPELKLDNEESYLQIAATFGAKEELEQHSLAEIVGEERAKELLGLVPRSVGAEFGEDEKQAVRELAAVINQMFSERGRLEKYVADEANRVMPNVCQLIEPLVAARLLSAAGSLKSLAEMPASTIQVIGAEKSLFKHLRTHGRVPSPKHGIIFQAAIIRGSPDAVRGKLARSLAAKIAIAVKADAFTGNDIAGKLKKDFDKRCDEVLSGKKRSAG